MSRSSLRRSREAITFGLARRTCHGVGAGVEVLVGEEEEEVGGSVSFTARVDDGGGGAVQRAGEVADFPPLQRPF